MAVLDDLRREIRQRAERVARAAAVQLEGELRKTSPKRTGQLRKSITVRVTKVGDVITTEAKAEAPHAEPVILGTRKNYPITPKKGQFLAFFWPNDPRDQTKVRKLPDGRVLLRHVTHPGLDPAPFWDLGIKKWGSILAHFAQRLR